MRMQKLLRVQIARFIPAGTEKLTDPKAQEEAATKQKTDFMAWTNDINKRAGLEDYLPLEAPQEDLPIPEQKTKTA